MQYDLGQTEKNGGSAAALLFFWAGQDVLAKQIADSIGTSDPLAFSPAAVTAAMRVGKSAVVLWRGPDFAMDGCLTHGNAVTAALDTWKHEARNLIGIFRKNRKSMILAEAETLRSGGLADLAERLGVQEISAYPAGKSPSALSLALTRLALEEDDDLRLLLDELLSASLPVREMVLSEVLDQVITQTIGTTLSLSALQDQLAIADQLVTVTEAQRAEMATGVDLLQNQLSHLEAAMTAQIEAARTADAAALQQIGTLEGTVAQHEKQSTALHFETLTLQASLAEREAEVETLTASLVEFQAKVEALRAELDLGEGRISAQSEAAKAAADASASRISALQEQVSQRERTSADLLADSAATHARLAERDAEAKSLLGQLDLERSKLAAQSSAAQSAAEAASKRIGVLNDLLAQQETQSAGLLADGLAVSTRLAERDADVGLLLAQLSLGQSDLLVQISASQTVAETATLRIGTLEALVATHALAATALESRLALADRQIPDIQAALEVERRNLDQALAEWTLVDAQQANQKGEADLLRDQLGLGMMDLERQSEAALAAAEVALLRISTLEGQLSLQAQTDAEIAETRKALAAERTKLALATAEAAQLARTLTERDVEIDALKRQLNDGHRSMNAQLAAAETRVDTATQRIKALEDEALARDQATKAAEGAARAIRGELSKIEKALADEHAKRVQAMLDKNQLTVELSDSAADVDLMSSQIRILQEGLSQVVAASAARDRSVDETSSGAADDTNAPAPRTDAWDKALAKALAASRHEADLRAKMEQELDAVKARLQSKVQREEDLNFNRKLFAQMTIEATASLDEIARLVAAHGSPVNGVSVLPYPSIQA